MIDAPSLQGAHLDNGKQQQLVVYLPPSYYTSNEQFPVIYYFHGYGGNAAESKVIGGANLDRMIKTGEAQPMIVVGINGNNKFGGSFFVNSPVIGHWEDFVTDDVVTYIDTNYRTLAQPKSRGLAGFSMGGYSAINIAFKHSEQFKHVFSLSPGFFDENGLDNATKQWISNGWDDFLDGYAAAFAVNLESKTSKKWNQWDANSAAVRAMWSSGFGDVKGKVAHYLQQKQSLSSIHIEYGRNDFFKWIPQGSRYLVKELRAHNVNVEEVEHPNGHDLGRKQAEHIITFFSKAFISKQS